MRTILALALKLLPVLFLLFSQSVHARYYDPETGRFISPDPSGYQDGPNLYAYVGNNPLNYTDPWGLRVENDSPYTIYVKGENDNYAAPVPPGGVYPDSQDGIAMPWNSGYVYKTINEIDATVNSNGTITLSSDSFLLLTGQWLLGGWKEYDFIEKHPDWKGLFDSSKGCL